MVPGTPNRLLQYSRISCASPGLTETSNEEPPRVDEVWIEPSRQFERGVKLVSVPRLEAGRLRQGGLAPKKPAPPVADMVGHDEGLVPRELSQVRGFPPWRGAQIEEVLPRLRIQDERWKHRCQSLDLVPSPEILEGAPGVLDALPPECLRNLRNWCERIALLCHRLSEFVRLDAQCIGPNVGRRPNLHGLEKR